MLRSGFVYRVDQAGDIEVVPDIGRSWQHDYYYAKWRAERKSAEVKQAHHENGTTYTKLNVYIGG